jgi:hypothetical protein
MRERRGVRGDDNDNITYIHITDNLIHEFVVGICACKVRTDDERRDRQEERTRI